MRVLLLLSLSLLCLGSPSLAGKNAGGSLVLHVCDPYYSCTLFLDPCIYYSLPERCEDTTPQAPYFDIGPNPKWVVAAFDETADPGVTSVYFGLDHNFPSGWWLGGHPCGPEGSFEISSPGWPNEPGSSTQIVFSEPITGNRLFKLYYFDNYVEAPVDNIYLRVIPHDELGIAAYLSDDTPPAIDRVENFGEIRWGEPGWNECATPQGACCFGGGGCVIATQAACLESGGVVWLYDLDCDSDPCATAGLEEDDPWIEQSWGRIKSRYE